MLNIWVSTPQCQAVSLIISPSVGVRFVLFCFKVSEHVALQITSTVLSLSGFEVTLKHAKLGRS